MEARGETETNKLTAALTMSRKQRESLQISPQSSVLMDFISSNQHTVSASKRPVTEI
jgi:hypothetical protein